MFATGIIASFVVFGVCNENAVSGTCAALNDSRFLIAIIPAMLTVGIGLFTRWTGLVVLAAACVGLQALIAVGVAIQGP